MMDDGHYGSSVVPIPTSANWCIVVINCGKSDLATEKRGQRKQTRLKVSTTCTHVFRMPVSVAWKSRLVAELTTYGIVKKPTFNVVQMKLDVVLRRVCENIVRQLRVGDTQ